MFEKFHQLHIEEPGRNVFHSLWSVLLKSFKGGGVLPRCQFYQPKRGFKLTPLQVHTSCPTLGRCNAQKKRQIQGLQIILRGHPSVGPS